MSHWVVVRILKLLTSILCRIDASDLSRVPERGPLILVTNHVNILEIPILYTRLQPRPVSGFFAAYRLRSAWMKWLLTTLGGIPVHRGQPDRQALGQAVNRIRSGEIFALAPEGTRSADGRLQIGRAGVLILARQAAAPILPVAFWGSEHWQRNLRRLRRTPFHVAVGKPLMIDVGGRKLDRSMRQEVVDELMMQIALLLPERYRGVYAGRPAETPRYLRFIDWESAGRTTP
ncbi:MAG: lysophospholipid acyltransferase family protein [Anaerolineales bacterium]|jgi:1-acyl-sn-glycerol-3-phosphate acyltransferase